MLGWSQNSIAHHSPAHGPSESLRTLGVMGSDPAPRRRVATIAQVSRSSREPNLNAATSYGLTTLMSLHFARRLFPFLELPLVMVQQDANPGLVGGLDNLRLGLDGQLGSLQRQGAPSVVLGVSVSLPTRTFRYQSDPGRSWVVTPGLRYADVENRWLWYFLLQSPVETRASGTAWESSLAAGIGVRSFPWWTVTVGSSVDVRLLTSCQGLQVKELCREGRATEQNRPTGATRVYGNLTSTLDLAREWSLSWAVQFPITTRRDVDWLASVGAEARF